MLRTYDREFVPNVFALRNSGSICYFNSLIQALLSCPAFNEYMWRNETRYARENNQVATEYVALLRRHLDNPAEVVALDDTAPLLGALLRARGGRSNLMPGQQEDLHEGLVMLLETIGGAEQVFHVRHRSEIHCRSCRVRRRAGDGALEPPEIVVDITEEQPMGREPLSTKESIETYITSSFQAPRDYRCENCRAENKSEEDKNVLQIYYLKRLSEVIVLLCKKYDNKTKRFFPAALDFPSELGPLHYEPVAQIEHSGTRYGGHYYARTRRVKLTGLHRARRAKADAMIRRIEETVIDPEARAERIRAVNAAIAGDAEEAEHQTGVFEVNDARARFVERIEASENTYMIFYHLVSAEGFP